MNRITFDFWDALLLCGIIQGLVVFILINTGKQVSRPASYFLSGTVLVFTLHNALILGRDTHLSKQVPFLENLPLNLVLGLGPCIYFYVFFALHPKSRANVFVHFVPVLIQFCYYLLLTITGTRHLTYPAWKVVSQTEQLSSIASVCIYTYMSLAIIKACQKVNIKPGAKAQTLTWFKTLLLLYTALWGIWLIYTLTDIFYFNYTLTLREYFPLYLVVAVITYWIGIKSYVHPVAIPGEGNRKSFSSIREEDIQRTLLALQDVMITKKLYFNPELNLRGVAAETGINVNLISHVVNNRLNKSFNEWLNSFRIEEFKKQAASQQIKELTITGISFECGFNSKATFNRAFKQQTGMTPTDYLAQLNGSK